MFTWWQGILAVIATIVIYLIVVFVSSHTGGVQVWLDGTLLPLGVVGQILMTYGYRSQWVAWIILDVIKVVIWFNQLSAGGPGTMSMFVLQVVMLANGFYGAWVWFHKSSTMAVSDDLQSSICTEEHNRKWWPLINQSFRREFTTIILVVGSASVGKTTLVTRLSKLYDAPIAVEYAREFEEACNVDDDELAAFDLRAADSFQVLSERACNSIACQSWHRFFLILMPWLRVSMRNAICRPMRTPSCKPTFDMVIEQEQPDLVLLIPPITEYVDDGFRAMRWASDRYRFHETLVRVIQESPYADRVVDA